MVTAKYTLIRVRKPSVKGKKAKKREIFVAEFPDGTGNGRRNNDKFTLYNFRG